MLSSEPKQDMLGKFKKYEVEDALRSLQRAEEVKADPELMSEVQKLAGKQMKQIKSIADLKEAGDLMDKKKDSEEPSKE